MPAAACAAVAILTTFTSPEERWWTLTGTPAGERATRLELDQRYGPLDDRRDGRVLLRVTHTQPAFWRGTVLEQFDGARWTAEPRRLHPLPEPAARTTHLDITTVGSRDDLVVAPGDIVDVDAPARRGEDGELRLRRRPQPGETRRVRARWVPMDRARLARAPAPREGRRLAPWLRLGTEAYGATMPAFGTRGDGRALRLVATSPYAPVLTIARRATSGARTPWEAVRGVLTYLRENHEYDTQVAAGGLPLLEFLAGRRAGYCQHFAGSAALLLRLSGIPARVAVGFAPGRRAGEAYEVRDVDAHAWLEVHFSGVGWVALEATPPAAEAEVPARLDPIAARAADGRGDLRPPPGALLVIGTAVLAFVGVRRLITTDAEGLLARAVGARSTRDPAITWSQLASGSRSSPSLAALIRRAERHAFAPSGKPARLSRRAVLAAAIRDLGPVTAVRRLRR